MTELATTTRVDPGHVARVAAGLRTAAGEAGVDLPSDYAQAVAADGLARCPQLGVTLLGGGVVLHTAPEGVDGLPVILGYANPGDRWRRDGSRHASSERTH